MRFYIPDNEYDFFYENVEAVIELAKKAYNSTKCYYKDDKTEDFLYFNINKTFMNGYCFYFARLLKSIYKDALFVVVDKNYAHIGHIFIKINDNIYDVLGKRTLKNYYVLTDEELKLIALNHKYIDKDVYEKFKEYFYDYVDLYRKYNLNFIKCYKKSLH